MSEQPKPTKLIVSKSEYGRAQTPVKKSHSHKRISLFGLSLLIGLPCVLCLLWVRKEQRQYAMDRELIAALKKNDTKQAWVLVEAGADPNTRLMPTPFPSWLELLNRLLRRSPPSANDSPTALMYACGALGNDEKGGYSSLL